MTSPRTVEQIRRWAGDLIDLSKRNSSLYYRTTKRSTLTFVSPDAVEILDWLQEGGAWKVFLPQPPATGGAPWTVADSREAAEPEELVTDRTVRSDIEATLKNLSRQTDLDFIDRGLQTLYVCFGMLRWRETSTATDWYRSPLLFVPVTLRRHSPRDPFQIERSDEDAILNPSLRMAMADQFGIQLPDRSQDSPYEVDLSGLLEDVRGAVTGHRWRVDPTVVLKRATFHKEAMYRDLLDNLDVIAGHPLVAALADPTVDVPALHDVDIPDEERIDEVAPPEDAYLIRDADASQRRAVAAATAGASFVVDGPPGTGKSQTIANIIAELMAAGRSVLFVSEKVAALDVAATRLREHGLDEFLFELHSHKVSRKQVVQELGQSLRYRAVAQPTFSPADIEHCRRLRVALSDYAKAVNRIRQPLGRSVHWVLGRLAQLHTLPALPPPGGPIAQLSAAGVAELQDRFDRLTRAWAPVSDPEGFVWRDLVLTDRRQAPHHELERLVSRLDAALGDCVELADELAYAAGLPSPRDLAGAARLADVCAFLAHQPTTRAEWWGSANLDQLVARVSQLRVAADSDAADRTALEVVYGPAWDELDPAAARLLEQAGAQAARLGTSVKLVADDGVDRLRTRCDFLQSTQELVAELRHAGPYLARSLGSRRLEFTLGDVADLAAVGACTDARHRPEATWLSPEAMARVQQAINVLQPLVRDYAARRSALAAVFDDAVYGLDLGALVDRFAHQHHGLRRLSGAYRADRRTVKSVSRSGKAGTRVRAKLTEALGLQQLGWRLDEAEQVNHQLLGRYYQPRATDVDAATQAMGLLRFALERLGTNYDPRSLAAQLAGASPADPALAGRARGLLLRLDQWRTHARSALHCEPTLDDFSLDQLDDWAGAALEATRSAIALLEDVDSLRGRPGTIASTHQELLARARIEQRREDLEAHAPADRAALSDWYAGFDTDTESLLARLRWVRELQLIHGGPLPRRAVTRLHGRVPAPDPAPVRAGTDQAQKLIETLVAHFQPQRQSELLDELEDSFDAGRDLLAVLADHLDQIDTWAAFNDLTEQLREAGWAAAIEECIAAQLSPDQLPLALEKCLYAAWVDANAAADPVLSGVRADDLDRWVEQFRRLDAAMVRDTAEWVVERCLERRPTTIVGVAKVIEREAQKKTRHMPVRRLLEQSAEVATALKPCFMMSPLSVSQFLPPTMRFDTVIFDEASQITPADAINCIYRGAQLVVAGDENQLPPTSFFQLTDEDDEAYDEAQFDEFESILNLSKGTAQLPTLPLRWHYRSQHESLITFSNYRFYDGRLVTFPGAQHESEDLGIGFFHVPDGVYRRGGPRDNPIEAQAVAERVIHHADRHPDRSLGVVAFSLAQAEAIENAVERARGARPDLDDYFAAGRLDGFFVKNLESVQGDERDIMLFSVGYGPDEAGKLTLNFGPLNPEGGWRRLNVAITRARRRNELFASFRAGDLDVRGSTSRGVQQLQRYLDYAERGEAALALDLTGSLGDVESPLEASVLSTLRDWGYDVDPQIGTAGYRIDLGVRHPARPGQYAIGIECDGAAYHSSKVARDRDRLRHEVLVGLGWRLHRVWGPSWYRDRNGQERALRKAVEQAAAASGMLGTSASRRIDVRRDVEEVVYDETPDWAEDYRSWQDDVGFFYPPHDPRSFSALVEAVRRILAVEAPIHFELLARRVAQRHGYNTTKRLKQAVSQAALTLQREHAAVRAGDFVWVGEEFAVRVPAPGDPDGRRDIVHIPPEEVAEAVYQLLVDARAAYEDDLLTQVGRLFGFARIGNRIQVALDEALDDLETRGLVVRGPDGILRPVDPTNAGA